MTISRLILLLTLFFSLSLTAHVHAASVTSSTLAGTWYTEGGKSITFKRNGTIKYRGTRYYYAVSSGGYIQFKNKHKELTVPFTFYKGKLTLTEHGEATVYRRNR